MNYQVAMSVSYHRGSGSGSSSAEAAGSNGPPGSQYRIPDELQEILLDFTVNYLIEQPSDIARFGVEYFVKLTSTRSNQNEDADHSEDESMLSDEEIRRNGLNIQVITITHTVSCYILFSFGTIFNSFLLVLGRLLSVRALLLCPNSR